VYSFVLCFMTHFGRFAPFACRGQVNKETASTVTHG
jgi:hypothetical protein